MSNVVDETGTIAEARQYIRDRLRSPSKAIRCPCCRQIVKLYQRRLNRTMARSLIALLQIYAREKTWIHVSRISGHGGGDFAKLRYWGFIVEHINESTKTRTSGLWKPTQAGVDFVLGRTTADLYKYVFNMEVFGGDTTQVGIVKVLKTQFDYDALMRDMPDFNGVEFQSTNEAAYHDDEWYGDNTDDDL